MCIYTWKTNQQELDHDQIMLNFSPLVVQGQAPCMMALSLSLPFVILLVGSACMGMCRHSKVILFPYNHGIPCKIKSMLYTSKLCTFQNFIMNVCHGLTAHTHTQCRKLRASFTVLVPTRYSFFLSVKTMTLSSTLTQEGRS